MEATTFLSTPSARRATRPVEDAGWSQQISIHSLREEGDGEFYTPQSVDLKFLSTPSARRATYTGPGLKSYQFISIHALREEGDAVGHEDGAGQLDFYPRPP